MSATDDQGVLTLGRRDHVLLMGLNRLLRDPVEIRDGHATVPGRPGTGVEWDEDAVARFELEP